MPRALCVPGHRGQVSGGAARKAGGKACARAHRSEPRLARPAPACTAGSEGGVQIYICIYGCDGGQARIAHPEAAADAERVGQRAGQRSHMPYRWRRGVGIMMV